jgi:hypothetical protein
MKAKGWFVSALFVGGVVFAMRGCLSSPAPDEKLAGRFDAMCKIARDNVKTPQRGVRKLGGYLSKHTGDILGEFGSTLEAIETIADDAKHDKRAELARDRMRAPVRACIGDWMQFADAVESDPEASALVDHFMLRLSRTLEIIAGSDLRALPLRLDRAIETIR